MKSVLVGLLCRLFASILVVCSFNLWLILQFIDYNNREVDTRPYFATSLTAQITILFYIVLYVIASILLQCNSIYPCSCCCVSSRSACCVRGQLLNSLKTNKLIVRPIYIILRSVSLLSTSVLFIWFVFAVLSGVIDHILTIGLFLDCSFIFQFSLKTFLDFKTMKQFLIGGEKEPVNRDGIVVARG
ncbi:Hypothetical_protein [Hexamita inflata]|uniref:Hypothetical_protein n=1 Tax=Hexamita inflata TaxID=28002 RepID=A0AA86TVB7_9EUKA|nr:Hypothetical protein HINF_LOCUS16142 [Hexamita inflata]